MPGRGRNADRPLRRNFDFRLDDVFGPVALAGGNIARKRKVWQRRHRDVVRAPDARFEHAAAPHRDRVRLAQIVHLPRGRVPAHAPELDVDDLAGAQFDRGARVLRVVDAFVEADRRLELPLQLARGNRCRRSRAAARSSSGERRRAASAAAHPRACTRNSRRPSAGCAESVRAARARARCPFPA